MQLRLAAKNPPITSNLGPNARTQQFSRADLVESPVNLNKGGVANRPGAVVPSALERELNAVLAENGSIGRQIVNRLDQLNRIYVKDALRRAAGTECLMGSRCAKIITNPQCLGAQAIGDQCHPRSANRSFE